VPNFDQFKLSANHRIAAGDLKYPYSLQNAATDWQHCVRILEKHWRLSMLFAATIFSAIAIVTFSITPVYE
jgi:hypothetical protein